MPVIGAGAGASPWTPADDIGRGLACWWDAADTSTISLSAAKVMTWYDKSGNGQHVSPANLEEPTTGSKTLNGNNVVTFAAGKRLIRSGATGLPTTGATIFSVQTTSSSGTGAVYDMRPSSGSAIIALLSDTGNAWFARRRNDANSIRSTSTSTRSAPFIATWSYDSASLLFRANGTNINSGSNAGTTTVNTLYLGNDSGGTYSLRGDLAEVIVYSVWLDNERQRTVERYLSAKWGIGLIDGGVSSPLVFR